MLGRTQRRVFEGLEQLTKGLRIAHQLVELSEALLLWLENFGCPVRRHPRFAQQIRRIPVLRSSEKNQQEIVEESADFFPHRRILLILEGVEERCDDGGTEIGGELTLDLLLQIFDFAVVEEVERRIEIV